MKVQETTLTTLAVGLVGLMLMALFLVLVIVPSMVLYTIFRGLKYLGEKLFAILRKGRT